MAHTWFSGSGLGSLAMALTNLSSVRWVDANTTTPLPIQNGTIEFPFAEIQPAISSLPGAGGVVLVSPGTYPANVVVDATKQWVQIGGLQRRPRYDPSGVFPAGILITGPVALTASDTAGFNPQLEIVNCHVNPIVTLIASPGGLAPSLYCENCTLDSQIIAASPLGVATEKVVLRDTLIPAMAGSITFNGAGLGNVWADDFSFASLFFAGALVNGVGFALGEVTRQLFQNVLGNVPIGTTAVIPVVDPLILAGLPATVTFTTPMGTNDIAIAVMQTYIGGVDYAVTNISRVGGVINDNVNLLLHSAAGVNGLLI
jgi:hypothetical protein